MPIAHPNPILPARHNICHRLFDGVPHHTEKNIAAPEAHKPLFERLLDAGLIELVRDNRHAEINLLLKEILGEEYTYVALMESMGSAKDSSAT